MLTGLFSYDASRPYNGHMGYKCFKYVFLMLHVAAMNQQEAPIGFPCTGNLSLHSQECSTPTEWESGIAVTPAPETD